MTPWRYLASTLASSLLLLGLGCGTPPATVEGNDSTAGGSAMSAVASTRGTQDREDHDACLRPDEKLAALCDPFGAGNWCQALCTNTNFVTPGATLTAGDHWTPAFGWITNVKGGSLEFPLVYPDWYSSSAPADWLVEPMRSFTENIKVLRIVVDPGTRQERVHVFRDTDESWKVVTVGDVFSVPASAFPDDPTWKWPAAWFVGVLHPLSIGHHTIVATWFFSEPLCDGIGTAMVQDGQGGSCYPAGWEHGFQPMYGVDEIDVTVVPGK